MKNEKVIYTAIFDNKDRVKHHSYVNADFDYLLFVDERTYEAQKEAIERSNWQVKVLPNAEDPRMAAKDIKIRSHKWVSSYELSIWVDGAFKQVGDLNTLAQLSDGFFAAVSHPFKACMYAEASACVLQKMDDPNVINRQVKKYFNDGYPKNNGLNMGGILWRVKHKRVSEFNNKWWKEIQEGSIRDQISFPYVAWKMGYYVCSMDFELSRKVLINQPHLK
jgi:hypothetical protein